MEEFSLGVVAQVSRRVSDVDAAVDWYSETLGLTLLYRFGDLAFFDLGGMRLFLTAGDEGSATHGESVLYFRVSDIHSAFAVLTARGVTFSGAPRLIYRHEGGVEEWMAFFVDQDGSTLALMSQVRSDDHLSAAIASEPPSQKAR